MIKSSSLAIPLVLIAAALWRILTIQDVTDPKTIEQMRLELDRKFSAIVYDSGNATTGRSLKVLDVSVSRPLLNASDGAAIFRVRYQIQGGEPQTLYLEQRRGRNQDGMYPASMLAYYTNLKG